MKKHNTWCLFPVLIVTGVWSAHAQEQPKAAALEEIVVTARKRTEDLQSVPVAVSAFQGKFLEEQFTSTVSDLERFTPNVQLQPIEYSGGGLTAAIRGVGFGDLEKSFEPAVAVSVDGLFLASNTGATIDSFDIASVEILRGPQGTLFGRNTVGGTVNITRTRPTGEWGLKAAVSYGSYDNKTFKAIANAPLLKDVLALKVGAYVSNGDLFTRNFVSGVRDRGASKVSFTSALLFTPSTNFEALLSYDHINDKSQFPKAVNLTTPGGLICDILPGGVGCIGASYDVAKAQDFKVSFTQKPFYAPLLSDSINLRMTWHGPWYDIESTTGYIGMHDKLSEENTGVPDLGGTPVFTAERNGTSNQFSQEVRMTSKLDSAFNYVAGVYYFKSRYTLNPQDIYLLGGQIQHFTASQDSKSYAAFAETYWTIAPQTRLTVGARYTRETKEFADTAFDTTQPQPFPVAFACPDPTLPTTDPSFAACRDPSVTFSKVTPRVSLDYKFTPDAMIYATWSRGFRSGGWNGRATSQTSIGPYDPETVDNYEVGVRTEWLDHRLRMNLTLFDEKYKNKQEEVLTPAPNGPPGSIETVVRNAAAATIKGVELEVTAAPVDNVTLYSSAGYLDAKYDRFDQYDAVSGQVLDVKDTRNLRYAPKITFNVGGNWRLPAPSMNGRFIVSGNYKWLDKFASSPVKDTSGLNRDIIPSYGQFDTSLSYERELSNHHSHFRASAYLNDAFHNGGRVIRTLDAGVFWFGEVNVARTWGVEFQYEY
jgi:iron complex outermembrane receptor protein